MYFNDKWFDRERQAECSSLWQSVYASNPDILRMQIERLCLRSR